MKFNILSIDAWGNGDGSWDWNQWYSVGKDLELPDSDITPRKVFAYLRNEGYLNAQSAGKVSMYDDQYNIVVCERANNMPIFALEYGSIEQ